MWIGLESLGNHRGRRFVQVVESSRRGACTKHAPRSKPQPHPQPRDGFVTWLPTLMQPQVEKGNWKATKHRVLTQLVVTSNNHVLRAYLVRAPCITSVSFLEDLKDLMAHNGPQVSLSGCQLCFETTALIVSGVSIIALFVLAQAKLDDVWRLPCTTHHLCLYLAAAIMDLAPGDQIFI